MNIALRASALDRLMPMHALVDARERLVRVGPSLAKLGVGSREGAPLRDVFEIRGMGTKSGAGLAALAGIPLSLTLRGDRPVRLRGVLLPGGEDGGWILNVAFGISEIVTMGGCEMTAEDFAPTDMTVDMLYLLEANATAMAEVRNLVGRLQAARSMAEEQALTDALTGLRNRRALANVLMRLTGRGTPFALMRLDLDYFKAVNDTHGHEAGDLLLQSVAAALIEEVRGTDIVARVGGDEFVLVLEGLLEIDRIEGLARRIIARLEQPFRAGRAICRISGSLGTTLSVYYAAVDPDVMLKDADAALYVSKEAGRGRHTMFAPPA